MSSSATVFDDESAVRTAVLLDSYSQSHYGLSLPALLQAADTPQGRGQYARLLGVVVKAPFATSHPRRPTKLTRARVALDWKPDAEVALSAPGTWQLEVMRLLASEKLRKPAEALAPAEALKLFERESTLGKFLFIAFRRRVCENREGRARVRSALDVVKGGSITASATTLVANALASVVPRHQAEAGTVILIAVALFLMQVGLDGFCEWSKQLTTDTGDRRKRGAG
jgi:hypothetical protein